VAYRPLSTRATATGFGRAASAASMSRIAPDSTDTVGARPVAYHLATLSFALALPVLTLAALLAWYYASSEYERIEQDALSEARAVIAASDRDLAGLIATTEVLSLSRLLQRVDLDGFDSQARDVYSRLGINVVLRDLAGQQLVNTRLPPGAPLPIRVVESDRVALDTKRPVVSDLFIGGVTGMPLFMVNSPVLRGEEVIYFLNLSLPPEHVRDVILETAPPPGWTVTIVDRRGHVIASTSRHDEVVGKPLPHAILEEIRNRNGVAGEMMADVMDEPVFVAFSRSQLSGWVAVVTVPTGLLSVPLRRTFVSLFGIAALVLALAGGLAVLFSRRIERPVGALAAEAARLGQGEIVRPLVTRVREVNALSTILAAASVERRAADAALREGEQRLRELQFELLHASRLSAMGEMAAALAHELNQPLGAATNFLNAAQLALAADRPDGAARALARLQKAAEQTVRAGTILRRLRDFVARGEPDKRIVRARPLVQDAVALAVVGARDPELRVRIDFDPKDPPPLLADAIQIQQVVFNLVRNALEATEGKQPREVVVATRDAGNAEVEISVVDAGSGLPADPETLFRPFGTTKRHGLGIGLSISRAIVEAHGGRLWAEPRPGGGAVFRFTVPAAQAMDAVDV
jgi:signal transduction histidine kinase